MKKVITLVTQIKLWPILLLDYSKGFGGKYGVQTDRVDKVRNIFINLILKSEYLPLSVIIWFR